METLQFSSSGTGEDHQGNFARLRLEEISNHGGGSFEAAFTYMSRKFPLFQVKNPWASNPLAEASLEWLFSRFAPEHIYEQARASEVGESIDEYGRDLLVQLDFASFLRDQTSLHGHDWVALDIVGSAEFQLIHWESMEKMYYEDLQPDEPNLLIRRIAFSARSVESPPWARIQPNRTFNILLVSSRTSRDPIDPLNCSEALMSAVEFNRSMGKASGPASITQVHIVRPGTWEAFEHVVRQSTAEWQKSGNQGPFFDVVHLDVHGEAENGVPQLLFMQTSNGRCLSTYQDVGAEVLAKCLNDAGINFVLITACHSARHDGSGESCFAKSLVEAGVGTVMAMSSALTSTAAGVITSSFYSYLTQRPSQGLRAMWVARQAMRDRRRIGRYGIHAELNDYCVPVIYSSALAAQDPLCAWTDFDEECREDEIGGGYMAERWEGSRLRNSQTIARARINSDSRRKILGREREIYELECLLSETNPSVHLYGPAGIGKTALVQFLGTWWVQTGFADQSHYVDMETSPTADVLRTLEELLAGDGSSKLIVVDHCITDPVCSNLSRSDQTALSAAVRKLGQKRHKVMVISRQQRDANWLKIPRYHLSGLPIHSCETLAVKHMTAGLGEEVNVGLESDYLECLIDFCDYNPLAIKYLFKGWGEVMKSDKDWSLRTIFDRQFANPTYCVGSREDPEMGVIQQYLGRLGESLHGGTSGTKLVEFEMGAGALVGPFDRSYAKFITTSTFLSTLMAAIPSGSAQNDGEFVIGLLRDYLVPSGWVKDTPEDITPGQPPVRYYRLHPLFANFLRLFSRPATSCPYLPDLFPYTYSDFMFSSHFLEGLSDGSSDGSSTRRRLEVETANFLSAVAMTLETSEHLGENPHRLLKSMIGEYHDQSVLSGVTVSFLALWQFQQTAADDDTVERLSPLLRGPIMSVWLVQLIKRIESRLEAGQFDQFPEDEKGNFGNLRSLVFLAQAAAEYFIGRDLRLTVAVVNSATRYLCRFADKLRAMSARVWSEINSLMLLHGFALLHSGYWEKAAQMLELVLRIARRISTNQEAGEKKKKPESLAPWPLKTPEATNAAGSSKFYMEELGERQQSLGAEWEIVLWRHCAVVGLLHCDRFLRNEARSAQLRMIFRSTFDLIKGTFPQRFREMTMIMGGNQWIDFDMWDYPLCCMGIRPWPSLWAQRIFAKANPANSSACARAKDALLNLVDRSVEEGRPSLQKSCYLKLVDIALDSGDWKVAATLAARGLDVDSAWLVGFWPRYSPEERFYDLNCLGVVLLRDKNLLGLRCLEAAVATRIGLPGHSFLNDQTSLCRSAASSAEKLNAAVDWVMLAAFLVRESLLQLVIVSEAVGNPDIILKHARRLIRPGEFRELDKSLQETVLDAARAIIGETVDWEIIVPMTKRQAEPSFELTQISVRIKASGEEFQFEGISKKWGTTLEFGDYILVEGRKVLTASVESILNSNLAEMRYLMTGEEFKTLDTYLPSLEEAINSIPDYSTWVTKLTANEQGEI